MIGYLTKQQLDRLKQHQYSVIGQSATESFLQPYWCWLVKQVPLWLAPNLITSLGLAVNVVTTVILACYCPLMTEAAPWWVYFLCAVGLFAYQSLDAIDGKQARRTGNQSPLGELFDHGCDSISMIFVCLGLSICMQFGYNYAPLLIFTTSAPFLFYCSHWQAYVTGTLRFHQFDVTEAQLIVITMFILTSIYGPQIWSFQIWNTGLNIKEAIVISSITGGLITIGLHLRAVLGGGPGKNGTTIAGNSVISPAIPIGFMMVVFSYICAKSDILQTHPTLLVLGVSIAYAKLTMRLVVAHMSKSAMGFADSAMISPILLALNIYLGNIVNPYMLLLFCSVLSWYDVLHYCWVVVLQIARHLRINVFTITPKLSSN
ncbi:Cholinephosphotransferase 1 [Trichoplax sp. H2]|nr:Cholinephosphotransferase 1 [Trichoplax sp. H2]|eukprot:RDD39841.1 Cholinephosphotransferase 1 [Trichoplax sp. H2]